MIGYILIAIGIACIVISIVLPKTGNNTHKKAQQNLNTKDILEFLFKNGAINEEQYVNAQYMQQNEFQNFINQHMQTMNQQQQDMFMQQMNLNQMEMNRLMSTGVEFGGFNSDINLNPGMLNEQFNQMNNDMFNNMNNNNMNNNGMF